MADTQTQHNVVKRTLDMLHALGCHVHGEAVAYTIIDELDLVKKIECTAPPPVLHLIPSCLRAARLVVRTENLTLHNEDVDCCVLPLENDKRMFRVMCVENSLCVIAMAYTPLVMRDLGLGCLDFIQMSSTTKTMYLRNNEGASTASATSLTSVMARLMRMQFCLAELTTPPKSAIKKAAALVNSGWTMDDNVHSQRGWVVARWLDMTIRPHEIRRKSCKNLDAHGECAICLTAFDDMDVVINLPCNHNFHAVSCGNSKKGEGICSWINKHPGPGSCPCCRGSLMIL